MSDILEQINSLTEQFSNLFEVEGLGDPASDVPPSTNKIKKDRKTKDGKVELVSVEDELFPYDGNKREQYRQKIIDTINNMIQGTATLEDLLQIVRQKKMPVKEGFEGVIELLTNLLEKETKSGENTVKEISYEKMPSGYVRKITYHGSGYNAWGEGNAEHNFLSKDEYEKETGKKYDELKEGFEGVIELLEEIINEVSVNYRGDSRRRMPINAEDVKRELQDTLMQYKDNLVAKGIAQGLEMHPEDKANLYNNPKGRDMVKRYKSMFRESSRRRISEKKCFENAIKLLENIIAERKYSDEEIKEIAKKVRPERAKKFSKACDDLDKVTQGKNPDNFTPVQKYRANRAAKKVERTQDRLNHVDDIINPTVKTPTGIKRANEGFEGAIELLEDIHTAIEKGSHEIKRPMLHAKAIMNYSNELQKAAKKELPKDKKNSIKAINNKMNEIAKKRGISPVDNYVDGNKTDESFGSAIEILEEIINEVSVGALARAAENSFPSREKEDNDLEKKRQEIHKLGSKTKSKKKIEKLYNELQDTLGKSIKANRRYNQAKNIVDLNLPKNSKVSVSKLVNSAKKSQVGRGLEHNAGSEVPYEKYKRTLKRVHRANDIADIKPDKLEVDEALKESIQQLSELFDRPDLLDDISMALTNKTIKQHLENQAKKLLGGKKKDKRAQEEHDKNKAKKEKGK